MRLTGPHRPRFEPLAKAGGSFRWGPASGQPPAGTLAVCFYRLDIAAHAASTAVVVHPAAVPIDAQVGTPACAAEAARSERTTASAVNVEIFMGFPFMESPDDRASWVSVITVSARDVPASARGTGSDAVFSTALG